MSRMLDWLNCFVFLCLASLVACKDEDHSCPGSECVVDDVEGLHMLQLKGSKQSSQRQCPFPVMPDYLISGKGCPDSGDTKNCLNNNKEYTTLREAWQACGQVADCGAIMEYSDHKYYLRRMSDPDLPTTEGDYLLRYQCTHDEELREEERLKQEEEKRKIEARRQEKEDNVHKAEVREMKVSDDEHPIFQDKYISGVWSQYIDEGGLHDIKDTSKEPEDIQKDISRDFSELFSQFANMDCGWDADDSSCAMGNQAFVHEKMRNATDVEPDDVWAYCGRICEEAGAGCGGFSYKQGSKTCYFRRNTRCGIKNEWGSNCFTKKIARHAADLKEDRAVVLRDTEVHHSKMYEVLEGHDCGYHPASATCGMDNMAWINAGARNVPLVSEDEIFSICGLICKEAGDVCGGFTYQLHNSTCWFRRNATCGVHEQDGTTCYSKKVKRPIIKLKAHDKNATQDHETTNNTAVLQERAPTEEGAADPAAAATDAANPADVPAVAAPEDPAAFPEPDPVAQQYWATGQSLEPGTVAW